MRHQIQAVKRNDNYFSPVIDKTLIASIITIKPEDAINVAENYLNEIANYVMDQNKNIKKPLIQYFYPNDVNCQQFMFYTFRSLGVLIQ